ncbi:putative Ras-related protein Rab-33 isoform X2 [Clavelina lepadiformis]|uniref:Ras-related protein Rab-33B n=1 Tax=Clavelina lepadiformis TaxID=159417 RepID=A0ABP0G5C1_CLALP
MSLKSKKEPQPQPQRRVFKVIVIGDSDVGKTCLTYRFCSGQFQDKTEATIGVDFRERMVDVDGELIKLQLWDTAGQERFRKSMVPHYYRNYSSFQNLPAWIEECNKYCSSSGGIPRILVGNKSDLKEKSEVDTNTAQRYADSHCMPLFEASAKEDKDFANIEAIFLTLAHKLKCHKPMMSGDYPSMKRATVLSIDKELVRKNSDSYCANC